MPDGSPTKWHLAHASWFFETFVLKPNIPSYQSLHPQYNYLFNSYYNAIGERHCRPKRGLISRPTVATPTPTAPTSTSTCMSCWSWRTRNSLRRLTPLVTSACTTSSSTRS